MIDGGTRHKVYLRAQRLESVDLPPYHDDEAQVIIRRKGKSKATTTRHPCPTSAGCSTDGSKSARRYTVVRTAAKASPSVSCGPAYCPVCPRIQAGQHSTRSRTVKMRAREPYRTACSSGRTATTFCPNTRTTAPSWTRYRTPSCSSRTMPMSRSRVSISPVTPLPRVARRTTSSSPRTVPSAGGLYQTTRCHIVRPAPRGLEG